MYSNYGLQLQQQPQGLNLSGNPMGLSASASDLFPAMSQYGLAQGAPVGEFGGYTGLPEIVQAQAAPVDKGLFSNFLSSKNADGSVDQGWGGMAFGAAQGLGNAFLAMKQYGLAKQSLEENKRQFQLNYDAQKTSTNAQLEDRQRARVASNAGAYKSVGDYMNEHGIK